MKQIDGADISGKKWPKSKINKTVKEFWGKEDNRIKYPELYKKYLAINFFEIAKEAK